jgi:hypothetical protein
MIRLTPIALFVLLALGGLSRAGEGDCCGHCGSKVHCQVMCEWATCKVLRYKVAYKDCPPPCCECCDDRWILGCCKPIKVVSLKPYEETKRYLVGSYVLRTCPQCQTQSKEALPPDAAPPIPPPAPKTAAVEAASYEVEKPKAAESRFPFFPANLPWRK